MLTSYVRIYQSGIEAIKENFPLQKDTESSHYFFDPYRIALYCHVNKKECTTGIGVLSFAPNGRIWCQTGIHCYSLNVMAAYYYCMEEILLEAEKCKSKSIEIMIPDKEIVKIINSKKPFKDKRFSSIHKHVRKLFKKFNKVEIVYRSKYPKSVKGRLKKEGVSASQPPEISLNGSWRNSSNMIYFNVGMTEDEMREWAKGYGEIMYEFMSNYLKDYEKENGREALMDFLQLVKEKKVKKLPLLKKQIEKERKMTTFKVSKSPFRKEILCQNCENAMIIEKGLLGKPEGDKKYVFRCKECLATRTINENGRTEYYGRYPKMHSKAS